MGLFPPGLTVCEVGPTYIWEAPPEKVQFESAGESEPETQETGRSFPLRPPQPELTGVPAPTGIIQHEHEHEAATDAR